jgi:hypothetical protein
MLDIEQLFCLIAGPVDVLPSLVDDSVPTFLFINRDTHFTIKGLSPALASLDILEGLTVECFFRYIASSCFI